MKALNSINFIKNFPKTKVKLELKTPQCLNLPNQIKYVDGNLTLNEIEKKAFFGEFELDRGMSIRNLNKKLSELADENSYIGFNIISKSDKLIKDLEESEINFINYKGLSCYQSACLQGFIHIVFPLAIKNLNKERKKLGKENVKNLDELKNNSTFNNTVIDTIKEILFIQGCGNGGTDKNGNIRYQAKKLFEIAPPILLGGQGTSNIGDSNNLHQQLAEQSKSLQSDIGVFFDSIGATNASPPSFKIKVTLNSVESDILSGKIKIIEINKKTIVSEVIKFSVEGKNEIYGNLVLKFSNLDLNDSFLDICKLIKSSPQIKQNNFSYRKITKTSDAIFMITERLVQGNTIKKQFNLYEKIYLNDGYFNSSNASYNENNGSTVFELKFVIFHRFYDEQNGHYIAYCKIRNKWHKFDDCHNNYAEIENPPLINNTITNYDPVAFYYVKNTKYNNDNCSIF